MVRSCVSLFGNSEQVPTSRPLKSSVMRGIAVDTMVVSKHTRNIPPFLNSLKVTLPTSAHSVRARWGNPNCSMLRFVYRCTVLVCFSCLRAKLDSKVAKGIYFSELCSTSYCTEYGVHENGTLTAPSHSSEPKNVGMCCKWNLG